MLAPHFTLARSCVWLRAQDEASLADFTARLRAFRPAATVLEAEIAQARTSKGTRGLLLWQIRAALVDNQGVLP